MAWPGLSQPVSRPRLFFGSAKIEQIEKSMSQIVGGGNGRQRVEGIPGGGFVFAVGGCMFGVIVQVGQPHGVADQHVEHNVVIDVQGAVLRGDAGQNRERFQVELTVFRGRDLIEQVLDAQGKGGLAGGHVGKNGAAFQTIAPLEFVADYQPAAMLKSCQMWL